MHPWLRYHTNRRVLSSALTLLPAFSGPLLTVPVQASIDRTLGFAGAPALSLSSNEENVLEENRK